LNGDIGTHASNCGPFHLHHGVEGFFFCYDCYRSAALIYAYEMCYQAHHLGLAKCVFVSDLIAIDSGLLDFLDCPGYLVLESIVAEGYLILAAVL